MNLNDLTLGQIKELVETFGGVGKPQNHPFVGKYVICRCVNAGVHAGTLVSQIGDKAVLENSRRLWSWKTKKGIALSGLSVYGLESGKIDTLVPSIALTGVIETIPCSKTAEESINAA